MTTPAPSHPPDTLDESALLADYLNPSLSLLDLSERHNLPIPHLVAWAERPDIASVLIRLKALADQRAALLAADHAPAAVISLSAASASALATAAEAETPALRLRAIESARKAASHMLRLAPRPRKATSPPATQESDAVPAEGLDASELGSSMDTAEPFLASELASESTPFIPCDHDEILAGASGP